MIPRLPGVELCHGYTHHLEMRSWGMDSGVCVPGALSIEGKPGLRPLFGVGRARILQIHYSDGDSDKEVSFFPLKYTRCAVALAECGFMDKEVADLHEKPGGKKANADLIVAGILNYNYW